MPFALDLKRQSTEDQNTEIGQGHLSIIAENVSFLHGIFINESDCCESETLGQ